MLDKILCMVLFVGFGMISIQSEASVIQTIKPNRIVRSHPTRHWPSATQDFQQQVYTFHFIYHSPLLSADEIFITFYKEFQDVFSVKYADLYLAQWLSGTPKPSEKDSLAEIQLAVWASDTAAVEELNALIKKHAGHVILGKEIEFKKVTAVAVPLEIYLEESATGKILFYTGIWTMFTPDSGEKWYAEVGASLKEKNKKKFMELISPKVSAEDLASIDANFDQAGYISISGKMVFLSDLDFFRGHETSNFSWTVTTEPDSLD